MPRVAAAFGASLERDWSEVGFEAAAFPELAAQALRRGELHHRISQDALIDWVLSAHELPPQDDLAALFAQPPLTLYRTNQFTVTALFWTHATTAIHQHAFSGAFQVLAGSSVHCEYDFVIEHTLSETVRFGSLERRTVEVLTRGDIRPIRAGPADIHSLFHLDKPSVTIVVRTFHESSTGPQYEYRPPSMAVDVFHPTPRVTRQLQIIRLLRELGDDAWAPGALRLIERSSAADAVELLNGLADDDVDREIFERCLAAAETRHGSVTPQLRDVYAERIRIRRLVAVRGQVADEGARYLLALLINGLARTEILDAVQRRFPGNDGAVLVARWLNTVLRAAYGAGLDGGLETAAAELLRQPRAAGPSTGDETRRRLLDVLTRSDITAPLVSP